MHGLFSTAILDAIEIATHCSAAKRREGELRIVTAPHWSMRNGIREPHPFEAWKQTKS